MKLSDLTPKEREDLTNQIKAEEKAKEEKKKSAKKDYKELAEGFVNDNIDKLVHHKDITGFLIAETMEAFKAIKELKEIAYGVKSQDSHTTTLKDGSASITVGRNVVIKFDGTETAGVEKIKDYMKSLSNDNENAKKLAKIVDRKLKTNHKTGFLNPASIIDLDSLRDEFNSDLFSEGLDIIKASQVRTENSTYVAGYKFVMVEDVEKKIEFRFTI